MSTLDASDVDGSRDGGLVDSHDGRGEGAMVCGSVQSGRFEDEAYIVREVCYGEEGAG